MTRLWKVWLAVLTLSALLAFSLTAATAQASCGTHVVRSGENLFRIGLRYGIDYRVLASFNGIYNPARIYVGQVLRMPCQGATAPPLSAAAPAVINTQVVIPAATLQPQYSPLYQAPAALYHSPAYTPIWDVQQGASFVDCTGFRARSSPIFSVKTGRRDMA